jgi:hypothetical protein
MAVNPQAPVQASPAAAPQEHTPAPPVDQSAETPASFSVPEQAPAGRDWFRDTMNQMRGYRTGAPVEEPAANPETPLASEQNRESAPASPQEQAQPSAETKSGTPPGQVRTYSQDEIARLVQAETDRRLDKHNREEAERRRRAEASAEVEQDRELRRKDPYGYARKMEQKEVEAQALMQQLQVAQTHVQRLGVDYDRTVVDPIVTAVPAQLRQALLANVGDGLDGRGTLVQGALKTLEKHWREAGFTDARKRLAQDQGFIKEILTRYGGQRTEPDSAPSIGSAPSASPNMNDRLRRMAGRY